ESVAGGLLGGVIRSGVARGLFSNEAGLGSAAIAHGAARTREPIRQGMVAMLGPFIDTIVVCTITALVIICTGAFELVEVKGKLTSAAFEMGMPGSGTLVSLTIIFFAFSTLISWSYYGGRAVDYLFGRKAVIIYRWVYVAFVFIGSVIHLGVVIDFCDAMNGLMAIPNLIALIVLSPLLASLTRDYIERMKKTHFP
ncbi:MAG: alanine:cation symporter family protein, partial [Proteobacteria bacterium]|nr:alanine:cation symporter family protein [Pseudomonadota bacterium]